jgi:glucose/arabinose dehydrogenase
MRTGILLVALALTLVVAPTAGAQPAPAPGYVDTLVVGGLSTPTAIAFLPDGRLLIAEKDGAIKLFDGSGAPATLISLGVCSAGEMGLLGIAVDPSFATKDFIYLYLTEGNGGCSNPDTRRNQIVRLRMTGTPTRNTIDAGSLRVLLGGLRTDNGNHNAGTLRFGPDNLLYASVGDTGAGDSGCPGASTNPYAQDLGALEGKILRITRGGGVPKDNPFVGFPGARGEVYALGFRNPFRFSFDPDGGRLWVGDVGQRAFEEINVVASGGNYSWPRCEGNRPVGCRLAGDVKPVFVYSHGRGCPGDNGPFLGHSITGGTFAGAAFGEQQGHYVFGDFVSDQIFRAPLMPGRGRFARAPVPIVTSAAGPVDFVRGPDGAIYYVAIFSGQVRRLAAVASPSEQMLAGGFLNLEAGPRIARLVTNDPSITLGGADDSADDPVQHGGSVRIRTEAGCGGPCDTTYPLAGWTYIGRRGLSLGYRYRSDTGPIRAVTIEPGRVGVYGRGPLLGHRLGLDPGPVDVVVRIGGLSYCLKFGGSVQYLAGAKFRAENAPAPTSCPAD